MKKLIEVLEVQNIGVGYIEVMMKADNEKVFVIDVKKVNNQWELFDRKGATIVSGDVYFDTACDMVKSAIDKYEQKATKFFIDDKEVRQEILTRLAS